MEAPVFCSAISGPGFTGMDGVIPGDDAARALEHFFLTGQRPSFIHWHDDKT